MLRARLLLSVWCVLSACVRHTPPVLDPRLRPDPTPVLLEAAERARECDLPVVAHVSLFGFRYGCFCGSGHPNIPTADGGPAHLLPDSTRTVHLAKLYAIRPVDDVDLACRDHDVCWSIRGSGDGACNDEFRKRLRFIRAAITKAPSSSDTKSLAWRCRILTGDMRTAFLTIFPKEQFDSRAASVGSFIGRGFSTIVFGGPLLVLRLPVWVKDAYPKTGERCLLPTITPSRSAEVEVLSASD